MTLKQWIDNGWLNENKGVYTLDKKQQLKKVGEARDLRDFLTGLLPASPVRKGGGEGSYSEMFVFLTGNPRAEARGGFTFGIVSMSNKTEE